MVPRRDWWDGSLLSGPPLCRLAVHWCSTLEGVFYLLEVSPGRLRLCIGKVPTLVGELEHPNMDLVVRLTDHY
jgi:hypothetical protein